MYVTGVKEKGEQRGEGPEETGTWRLLSGFRMLIGDSLGGVDLSLDPLGFAAQTGSWKKPKELSAEAVWGSVASRNLPSAIAPRPGSSARCRCRLP